MKTQKVDTSLNNLRDILFNELNGLQGGSSNAQQAIAVSKLSAQVIYSYRVEIEAVVAHDRVKNSLPLSHIIK